MLQATAISTFTVSNCKVGVTWS